MANNNFVVHNGLTVGPLVIDAGTGTIATTGALGTNYLNSSTTAVPGSANVDLSTNGSTELFVGGNTDPFGQSLINLIWYDMMNPNNTLVTVDMGQGGSI